MFAIHLLSAFLIVVAWPFIAEAGPSAIGPVTTDFRVRHAPGESASAILARLRTLLARESQKLAGRSTVMKSSTSFEKSWNNAVLFTKSMAAVSSGNRTHTTATLDVEIVCTTCYIKSTVVAQLTIAGEFNATEALDAAMNDWTDDMKNLTLAVKDTAEDVLKEAVTGDLDFTDITFPTMDFDFDLNIANIPEISVRLQFESTELYVAFDMILSSGATYTLHLYSSTTPAGFAIGKDLELGLVLNVDLILSVESEVDISSGFHLALDDGLELNFDLFGSNVSDIVFPGGRFEFLPVTITTDGITLRALLRLRVDLGITFATSSIQVFNETVSMGAGIEGSIFANVAEFVTNVTLPEDDESECSFEVEEYYQFAFGAAVGATIHIGDDFWGPMPSTTFALFYTTLASACADSKVETATSASPTSSQLAQRFRLVDNAEIASSSMTDSSASEFSIATITTETTYVGQSCKIIGLFNCPASQVVTVTFDTTLSLTTTVPSGFDPTWPTYTYSTITSTVDFGSRAHKIGESEGPTTSSSPGVVADLENIKTGNGSKKIIIGLCLGLGIPTVFAVVGGCIYFSRRRKKGHNIRYTRTVHDDLVKDEQGEELIALNRGLLSSP